ncbi:MAG: DEAD/DEAH box helicase family protein [Methylotenera sp.]|nr:DEAD/DEAH box helicase family protein [Oligoflexia bacterium]
MRQFPRIALARGREYFNGGRVSDPVWTDSKAVLQVQGIGGNYNVTYDFTQAGDSRRLLGDCDCPAYAKGVLCKHLWAAILQLDKADPTRTLPESGPLKLIHSQPRPRGNPLPGGQVQQHGGRGPQPGVPSIRPAGPGVGRSFPPPPQVQPRVNLGTWLERLNQLQGVSSASSTQIISTTAVAYFVIAGSETNASGKLVLDLWTRNRSSNGDLGPLRPNRVSSHDFTHFSDLRDQEVLSMLTRSSDPQIFAPFGRSSANISSRFLVDSIFEPHLIPQLASAGKLFLSRSPNGAPDAAERPIRMDRGKTWDLELKIEPANLETYKLEGILKRDGEIRSLSEPAAILRSGFVIFEERIGRFTESRHAFWASQLRAAEFLVPRAQGDALLTRILLDPTSPRLTWPQDMGWNLSVIEPKPKGVFRPLGNDPTTGRMTLTVSFDYAGREVALSETEMTFVDIAQKKVYSRNQEFEEKTLVHALEILRDPQGTGSVPLSDLHRAANELCVAGWTIYIENQKLQITDDFSMNVSSNTDWFDLHLEASYGDNAISQADLMAALESKSGLVKLKDGSLGMLPQEWIDRYASLSQFGEITGENAFRFSKSQGLMLNNMLTDQTHLKADDGFMNFRERVRQFEGIETAKAPAGFNGKLRSYQKEGLTWLKFLEEFETGGILADDMGLGKTIQILAFLQSRKATRKRPSIVVAPKSLAFNWMDEAEKFVPDLKVVRYAGAGRTQLLKDMHEADLIVTTYGTLRTDIEKLQEFEFEVAIVDEAQVIKNAKSLSAIATKKLRARHRIALTGTPIENSLNDLISILGFSNPGLLNFSQQKDMKQDTQQILARMLRPFMLRRTKEKVLTELPDKSEQVLFCEMSTTERQYYNAIRDKYRASLAEKIEQGGLGASKMHVLEALLRLRQAACHSGLIDPKRKSEPSAKLQLLLSHIQEVTQEGHKVLVFSQFTSLLALVRTKLEEENIVYEYLDGKTEDRKTPVERFQTDPKVPVFLISLKAGGVGLNLTAADYVFILDPWWNPAVEAQAIGRAHRMGQSQKVFAYRMIAKGTVEEKILELQKTKRDLAESIISEDENFMGKLTREDLESLLT